MKINEGRYYQNSKGLIRYVKGFEQKLNRWGSWYNVVYQPMTPTGNMGVEKRCALSTMEGWAKKEWDPESANYISPKREQAMELLFEDPNFTMTSTAKEFVSLVVEAAKDELRRELGLEACRG